MADTPRTRQPRCFLVYALAPADMPASQANHEFNDFIADRDLPLAVFHDHFIGQAGGVAVFFAETHAERDALLDGEHLPGWDVSMHPLIFARSPAAFDEQIAFTLNAYRDQDWEQLQRESRPSYGDPRAEAESAQEVEVERE